MPDEKVPPESIEPSINAENNDIFLSDAEKQKLQVELDSKSLTLSHRKWIIGILLVISIVLYVVFIWGVCIIIYKEVFTPYTMIPISFIGIIPTAVVISIIHGIYPNTKEQKDEDITKIIPTGIASTVIKSATPPQQ